VARMVLVADDSPTHQRRANGILTGEGFEVATVSNGVAAIKKLPALKPALVLADVSMPGRDGYEVCEFVKNTPDLAHVPVLLIFSDLEPYDESRAQRVGANGRIKKPFGQDELVTAVNRFVAKIEAPPPLPPPVPAAVEVPPAMVTEPVDLPPEVSTKEEFPDLGQLSEGMAFVVPAVEDAAAMPPEIAPPAVTVEETLSARLGAAEEAVLPEAPPVPEAPTVEEPPSPEPVPSREVAEAEAAPPVVAEAVPPAGPMLVEEPVEPWPPPEEERVERTMLFRMPVEIAEPILAEDLAPAAAVEEAPTIAPPGPAEPPLEAAAEGPRLAEAGAGEVGVAPPEIAMPAEVPPFPELETPPPEPALETPAAVAEAALAPVAEPAPEVVSGPVAAVDADLVYWIVHNVVVRMAPPALATSTVEDLIRQISDEMINELTQPPPEPQA